MCETQEPAILTPHNTRSMHFADSRLKCTGETHRRGCRGEQACHCCCGRDNDHEQCHPVPLHTPI